MGYYNGDIGVNQGGVLIFPDFVKFTYFNERENAVKVGNELVDMCNNMDEYMLEETESQFYNNHNESKTPEFKAYDRKTNTMYDVAAINFYENTFSWIDYDYENVDRTWEDEYIDEHVVLLQKINLVDVNGVELFEGDIVTVTSSDQWGETRVFKDVIKSPIAYSLEEARRLDYADEIESTGYNVYENPEAL